MNKTHKKLDKQCVQALTNACEIMKDWDIGFVWLTHVANYNHYPESLIITCVFNTDDDSVVAQNSQFRSRIHQLLADCLQLGARFNPLHQVRFDSEQACNNEDNGNWQRRLQRRVH